MTRAVSQRFCWLRRMIEEVSLDSLENGRQRRILLVLVVLGALDDAFDFLLRWLIRLAPERIVGNV